MKKKFACLLLAALTVLCSCSEETGVSSSAVSDTSSVSSAQPHIYESFRLAYNQTESLNPFVTESALNRFTADLICETLLTHEGELLLASSVTPSDDFLTYTVTVRNDVSFSDGTALTVSDVVKSANRAALQNVLSVTQSENAAVFTLSLPDPDFAAFLTFPVVKNGSADEIYLGTGAYAFSEEKTVLVRNPYYANGEAKTEKIRLVGTDNASSLHYMLSSDVIDAYYTEHPAKVSGSFSVAECLTDTKGFLAFRASGLCADTVFRRLLLQQLNMDLLLEKTDTYASPLKQERVESDLSQYLRENGYDRLDADGYLIKTQKRNTVVAAVTLGCFHTNQSLAEEIAEQLKEAGLCVTVVPCESFAETECDMYLAEITLSANGDITELLTLSGADTAPYFAYRTGTIGKEELNEWLNETLPFAYLYNCKGKLLYNRSFAEGVQTNARCPYQNAKKWYLYD